MIVADIDVAAATTTTTAAVENNNKYAADNTNNNKNTTTLQMSSSSTRAVNELTLLQFGRPKWVDKFDFLSNMTFTSPGTVIYQPPSVVQLRNAGAVLVDEIAEMYNKLPRIVLRTEIKQQTTTSSTNQNTTVSASSKQPLLLHSPLSCRSSTMRRPWKPIIREIGEVHNSSADSMIINRSMLTDYKDNDNVGKTETNNEKRGTNYSIDTTLTLEEIESILPPSPMDWTNEIREAVLHRPHDPSEAAYEDDFLRTLYSHHDKAQRKRALRKHDMCNAPSPSQTSHRHNSVSSSSLVHQTIERQLPSALSSHSLLEENHIHKDNPHDDKNNTITATNNKSNNDNNTVINAIAANKNESAYAPMSTSSQNMNAATSTCQTAKGLIRRAQFNNAQLERLSSKVNKKVASSNVNSYTNANNTKGVRRVERKAPNLPKAPRPAKANTSVHSVLESNKNIRVGSVESTSSAAAPGITSAISPLSYDNNNITSMSNFTSKYYYNINNNNSNSKDNRKNSNTYILHQVEESPIHANVFSTVQHTRVGSTSHVTHFHSAYRTSYTQSLSSPSQPQQHPHRQLQQQHGNAGFIFPVLSSTASELSLRYDVNTSIAESSTCTPTTFDGALSPVSTVCNNRHYYGSNNNNSVHASNSIPRVIIRSGVNYSKMLAPGRIEKDLNLLRCDSANFNVPPTTEQISLSASEPHMITLNTANAKIANNEKKDNVSNNVTEKANDIISHNNSSSEDRKNTPYQNKNTATLNSNATTEITSSHTLPLGKELKTQNKEEALHLLNTKQPLVYSAYGYASLNANKTNTAFSSAEQTPNTKDIVIDAKNNNVTNLSPQRRSKVVDRKDNNLNVDVKNSMAKDKLVDKATNALKQFVSTLNKQNNYSGSNYTTRNDERTVNNTNNEVGKNEKTQMRENNRGTYDRSHTPPKLLRTGRGERHKYNLSCTSILPQTSSNDKCALVTSLQENYNQSQPKEELYTTTTNITVNITGKEELSGRASNELSHNKNCDKEEEKTINANNTHSQHKLGNKFNESESEETLPSPSLPSGSLEASSSSILSMLQTHSFKMNEVHEPNEAVTVSVPEHVPVQSEHSIPPLSLPAQSTNYTDVTLSTILTTKTASSGSNSGFNVNVSRTTSLQYAQPQTPDQWNTRAVNEGEKTDRPNVTETQKASNIAPTTSLNSCTVNPKDIATVTAADVDDNNMKMMNSANSEKEMLEMSPRKADESSVITTNNISDRKTNSSEKSDSQISSKVNHASVVTRELEKDTNVEDAITNRKNAEQNVITGTKGKEEMTSQEEATSRTEDVILSNKIQRMTLPRVDNQKVSDMITAIPDITQQGDEDVELNTVNFALTNKCTSNVQADNKHLLDTTTENNKNFNADDNVCIIKKEDKFDDNDIYKNSKNKKKKGRKTGEFNINKQTGTVKTKAACCTIM